MTITTKPDPNPRRSHGMLSRITRRWHLILALWMLNSIPIVYLIYRFVEPTYEAFSTLHVAPGEIPIFVSSFPDPELNDAIASYMQTQVALITCDRVLSSAIASPEVVNLSTLKEPDDPRTDVRENMVVEIVPNTRLIRVALELPDGNQAAAIVNAVVHSYLAYNGEYTRSANSALRQSLVSQLEKYKNAITEKRAELTVLAQKRVFEISLNGRTLNQSGKLSDPARPTLETITEAQSQRIADELIDTDLELIKVQSTLEATQATSKGENDPRSDKP